MDVLYALESIRTPFLDKLMSALSFIGGETVFMVIAIVVFWCVSKKWGYYILSVGLFGTVLNQFLKLMFRIPRPWVRDPSFSIVESARAEATGYSFPSGHTQNIFATMGCTARFTKRKWLRAVCIAVIVLVGFSRMYVGVHTPLDVGVSAVIGCIFVFAAYPIFEKSDEDPRIMYIVLSVMFILCAVYTAFVSLHVWPADIDADNLASGIKNGFSMSGAVLGMLAAYHLDVKKVHFDVTAPLWAQAVKTVAGLAIILAIKELTKAPLNAVFAGSGMAHAVRYFLVVFFAAGVWPMTFGWFARGCRKKAG